MNGPKKIAMLTSFQGYLESYSLVQIARLQLKMLQKNGYECRFIFRGGDEAEWRKFTPDIQTIPDYIVDNDGSSKDMERRSGKTFEQLTMDTLEAYEKVLAGAEVIITHDQIFQLSNNIQDAAGALYAEKHPEVLWLHWVHSATSARNTKKARHAYRNSFVVYPNSWDVPRVAKSFGYEDNDVKVVPHPIDYAEFFDFHPITEKLIEERGLLGADIVGCYPLRLDRGKQPEFCIRIFNQLKEHFKRSIRLVIIDFQSTGGDKVTYRNDMLGMAAKMGWTANELTFMSQFDERCFLQTPKKVVRDLFLLSNVYIHPSKSETYSLTTQEARACKNLLVLNWDFPAMRSIYGDGPLYKKFSSCVDIFNGEDGNTNTTYRDGVDGYCKEVAGNILYCLENEAVLKMSTETRVHKNLQAVFKKYMEPLFFAKGRD